jgi:DNA anti-recombination protein RmuC
MYEKEVFKKIAEIGKKTTELKSERVALKDIDTLKKLSSSINKAHNQILDFEDKISDQVTKMKGQAQDLVSMGEKAEAELNEFAKTAKSLGINPNSIKEYSNLIEEVKTAIETGKDIDKVY